MICVTKDGKVVWDKFIEHKMKSKGTKSESYYEFEWVNDQPTYIYNNDKNDVMALSLDPDGKVQDKRMKLKYKPRKLKKEEYLDLYNIESEMIYANNGVFVCVGSYFMDMQTAIDREGEPKEEDTGKKKKKKKKNNGKCLLVYVVTEKVDMEDKPIASPPPAEKPTTPDTTTKTIKPAATIVSEKPKTTVPPKPATPPITAPKK